MHWFNGTQTEHLPINDRSAAFGDGCFTTIAISHRQPEFLPQHLQRLQTTATRLRFNGVDFPALKQEIETISRTYTHAVLRVNISRGQSQSGYPYAQNVIANRWISVRAWPEHVTVWAEQGIHVRLCETRLSQNGLLAGLKHCNRLEQVLARAEWSDIQFAEGLMRDTDDFVIEGTCSNLFFVDEQGTLCTPSLHLSGVDGIIRQQILLEAELKGLAVRVDDFQLDALLAAQEVFMSNCVMGVVPVISCEGRQWPVGALTRALQNQLISTKRNVPSL